MPRRDGGINPRIRGPKFAPPPVAGVSDTGVTVPELGMLQRYPHVKVHRDETIDCKETPCRSLN
ncbi:hypothetical protein GCM10010403_10440 [Glycomyces rutgersensis]|uniref:Uncharacterized protein n=1 Tax=Glycomyces rutgersensis TaxID=58115 RepID=A0ABP5S7Y6_9ACTN